MKEQVHSAIATPEINVGMQHIFISYSRIDQVFVDSLIQDLEGRGFDCWVDRQDIHGGAAWRKAISRCIHKCSAFLIVISPQSVASPMVAQEVSLAEKCGRRIIPVIYKSCEISPGLGLQFYNLNWIDFEAEPYDESLIRLEIAAHSVIGKPYPAPGKRRSETHVKCIGGFYLCSGVYHLSTVLYFLAGGQNFVGDQVDFLRSLGPYELSLRITIPLIQIAGALLVLRFKEFSVQVFGLAWGFYTAYVVYGGYVAWEFNRTGIGSAQSAPWSDEILLGTLVAYGILSCVVYYLFLLKGRGMFRSPRLHGKGKRSVLKTS